MVDRTAVEVRGVFSHPKTGAPLVFLADHEETLVLPVVVGLLEAQSILIAQYPHLLARPLTHDFLTSVLSTVSARVREVEVTDLVDGTYFALMTLEDHAGTVHQIDARPSDALAIALRVNAPIYVHRHLFTTNGDRVGDAKALLDFLRLEAEDERTHSNDQPRDDR